VTNAIKVAEYLRSKHVYGEMHLQKLLYYSQAWSLAWTGKALFTDEIEAWVGGPVIRQVWAAGKHSDYVVPADGESLNEDQRAIIDAVFAHYGTDGGGSLSVRTHREDPWLEARGDLSPNAPSTNVLSQSTIRRYFSRMAAAGEDAPVAPTTRGETASNARVGAAGERQAARWRAALNALALR
jgi:uncharacterized phage-associated protein